MKKVTKNEEDMKIFVLQLVDMIKIELGKSAIVVALEGPLGAGKTVFTKFLARTIGVLSEPTSPTFVLHIPHSSSDGRVTLDHIDAWRLESVDELEKIGIHEMLKNNHLVVVEWADKFRKYVESLKIESKLFWVNINYGETENERVVELREV